MFKLLTCFAILVASALTVGAAEFAPTIAARAKSISELVPQGWLIQAQAIGDLNGDARPDVVMVLCKGETREKIKSNPMRCANALPKIVVAAFRDKGDGYYVIAQNHTLIPSGAQVGDAVSFNENGLGIRRGSFRLRLDYIRGNATFIFRFRNGSFKLIGYDCAGATAAGYFEEISINFLTDEIRRVVGYTDATSSKDKVTRNKVAHKSIIDLNEIGDGSLYRPESVQ